MATDLAIDLARQALSGIRAAHTAGVLHCDLKPDNILIGEGNRIAITDFGISRVLGSQRGSAAATRGRRARPSSTWTATAGSTSSWAAT